MTAELRFVVPSSIGAERAQLAVDELCPWLSDRLGAPVEASAVDSYAGMSDALLGSARVAGWAPPLVCARVVAHGGSVPLRIARYGSDRCCAAVVQRRCEVLTMERLRVAWVSPESTAGYLLPRAWMWRQGFVPQRVVFEERFVGTYDAAVDALLAQTVDVAVVPAYGAEPVRVPLLEALPPARRGALEVLLTTGSAPNEGVALSRGVPPGVAAELCQAFLELAETPVGRALCERIFQAERFVPCTDGYAEMAGLVAAASGLVVDGHSDGTEASEWSEELKVATVLFADIVDYTRSVHRLSPDLVHEFTNAAFAPLAEEVERRGGTVLKYIGDCVMAVFGVPRAHADDPLRAVDAALAMNQRSLSMSGDLARRFGSRVAMRIGVHTGLVMVGAMGDTGSPDVVGSTVNVASRIQTEASPGEILVGPRTARAIRGQIDLEEVGARALRGIDEPLVLHRVVGRSMATAAPPLSIPSFVHAELRARILSHYTDTVVRGGARVLRVQAPPASPSASFVDPLVADLESLAEPPLVLRAALASPDDLTESPLAFLGRLVRAASGVETTEGARVALSASLSGVLPDPDAVGVLLDLALPSTTDRAGPATEEDRLEAELPRVTFVEWVHELAHRQPVVLLLTRVHRADRDALDVIEKLLMRCSDRKALFVLYEEADELRPLEHPLPEERLEVLPLPDSAMERIVLQLLEPVAGVPEDVLRNIAELAQGSADHAVEVVQLLYQVGAIRSRDGSLAWVPGENPLPDTVREVLQVRIDRLSPEQKQVLRAAAVVGPRFWRGAVHAIIGTETALRTERVFSELVRIGMVRHHRMSHIAGEVEYGFRSRLVHELVYASLSRRTRERHHEDVAEWLVERLGRFGVDHAAIAAHLSAANLPERARPHQVRAARAAAAVGAYEQAAVSYERALAGWPEDRVAERGTLAWECAVALTRAGAFDEADAAIGRAEKDLSRASALSWEARVGLSLARAAIAKSRGLQEELVARLEEALHGSLPGAVRMDVLSEVAFAQLSRGDREAARGAVDEARKLEAHGRDDPTRFASARAKLADTEGALALADGDLAAAEAAFTKALSLREKEGATRLGRLNAWVNLGAIAFSRGDYPRAIDHFGQALDVASVACWPRQMAMCRSNLGQALLRADRAEEGVRHLERASELAKQRGLYDIASDADRALAEVLASTDPVRARTLAGDAVSLAKRTSSRELVEAAEAVLRRTRG